MWGDRGAAKSAPRVFTSAFEADEMTQRLPMRDSTRDSFTRSGADASLGGPPPIAKRPKVRAPAWSSASADRRASHREIFTGADEA